MLGSMKMECRNYQLKSIRIHSRSDCVLPKVVFDDVNGWIQSNMTRVRSDHNQFRPNVMSFMTPRPTEVRFRFEIRALASQAPRLCPAVVKNRLL